MKIITQPIPPSVHFSVKSFLYYTLIWIIFTKKPYSGVILTFFRRFRMKSCVIFFCDPHFCTNPNAVVQYFSDILNNTQIPVYRILVAPIPAGPDRSTPTIIQNGQLPRIAFSTSVMKSRFSSLRISDFCSVPLKIHMCFPQFIFMRPEVHIHAPLSCSDACFLRSSLLLAFAPAALHFVQPSALRFHITALDAFPTRTDTAIAAAIIMK